MNRISRPILVLASLMIAAGMMVFWLTAARAANKELAVNGPTALVNHSLTQVGGSLYMFGGGSITSTASSQLWRFDPASSTWSMVSPSGEHPVGRYKHAAASITNTLYILGGEGQGGAKLDDVWRYDPATETWHEVSQETRPPARSGHTAIGKASNNTLLVYGGVMQTPTMAAAVWQYDPVTGYWSIPMPMENPQGGHDGHAAGVIHNKMYIVGGASTGSDFIQGYDLSTNQFASITATAGSPRPPIRSDQATAFTNNDIYIFGGSNITGTCSDSWRFNTSTHTWVQLPDLPSSLTGAKAAYITSTMSLALPLGASAPLSGTLNILITGGMNEEGDLNSTSYLFDGDEYKPVLASFSVFLPLTTK